MQIPTIVEEEESFLQECYPHRLNLVIKQGRGCYVFDSEEKRYLDCFSGIAVNNVGHCHPKVVKAIQEQSSKLLHTSGYFHTEPMAHLVKKLSSVLPEGMNRTFLCNSGAEAVEGSVKLAKKYARFRGKSGLHVIALKGAFHGRLGLSLSLTGQSKFKRDLANFANFPGVIHVPFPYLYRSKLDEEDLVENCINELEDAISLISTEQEFACFIGEPIQGEAGLIVPPDDYYPKVSSLLKQHEIPLISDEVQTGFGRTGRMFGFELWELKPDIVSMAKGMGGGMPIGAFSTREEISRAWKPSDHFSTFGGNPVCCAAAVATIETIKQENLARNAEEIGRQVLESLTDYEKSNQMENVGEVRGKGLMIGIELVSDKKSKKPDSMLASKIQERMLERGVIIGVGGLFGNVLRIQPPLIIDQSQAEILVQTLLECFKS